MYSVQYCTISINYKYQSRSYNFNKSMPLHCLRITAQMCIQSINSPVCPSTTHSNTASPRQYGASGPAVISKEEQSGCVCYSVLYILQTEQSSGQCRDGISCQFILTIHSFSSSFYYFSLLLLLINTSLSSSFSLTELSFRADCMNTTQWLSLLN